MADIRVEKDVQAVAELAAAEAWRVLTNAIAQHGEAVWVLAGGTAPLAAYAVLAQKYSRMIDWKKVTIAIGDERCVPFDSPDSNWRQITEVLLKPLKISQEQCLVPPMDITLPEAAADAYAAKFAQLPRLADAVPRLDLVWLGVGEDGHTLSLFPTRAEADAARFVVAVHESPKPPADRISLTLAALAGTQVCAILATGAGKMAAVGRALQDDPAIPVARAAKAILSAGGKVTWMLDVQAAGSSTVSPTRRSITV